MSVCLLTHTHTHSVSPSLSLSLSLTLSHSLSNWGFLTLALSLSLVGPVFAQAAWRASSLHGCLCSASPGPAKEPSVGLGVPTRASLCWLPAGAVTPTQTHVHSSPHIQREGRVGGAQGSIHMSSNGRDSLAILGDGRPVSRRDVRTHTTARFCLTSADGRISAAVVAPSLLLRLLLLLVL